MTPALNPLDSLVGFSRGALGHDPWPVQEQILDSVWRNRLTAVKSCHSSGKCVAASEIITLSNGRRVTAESLVGEGFELLTRTPAGIVPVWALAEWNTDIPEPVYELVTDSGRRAKRNADHPFWIGRSKNPDINRCRDIKSFGWTALENVRTGDLVAVTDEFPHRSDRGNEISDEEIKILAYLIGDGGLTHCATFSKSEGPQLNEFRECCESIGSHLVYVGTGVDYRVVGEGTRRVEHDDGWVGGIRCNPVLDLLETHGLRKKHARDKFIPAIIFSLPRSRQALFLSRLYATDGWACAAPIPQVGYCSASVRLIRELQDLLIRFGVAGRIRERIVNGTSYWELDIAAAYDVDRFCSEIGIYGKDDGVREAWGRAKEQLSGGKVRKWRWKSVPKGTRWDKVKSVERVADERTVAITVPGHETFLTSFWEHNTFLAADATLGWIAMHDEGIVITTAPGFTQVEKVLWGEIRNSLLTSKVVFPKPNLTELKITDKNYAIGISTNETTRFQGFKGKHVLIILDEAPGVSAAVWEALRGLMASGVVHVLAIGNPTITGGEYHDAFTTKRHLWKTYTISAFNTPNLADCYMDVEEEDPKTGKKTIRRIGQGTQDLLAMSQDELDVTVRPYLVSRRYVREMYEELGADNGIFQGRVLGEFPTQSTDTLIPLSWLERAKTTERVKGKGVIRAGLDVAGPGEAETVLSVFEDDHLVLHKWWAKADPRGEVVAEMEPFKSRLSVFNIDSIGIGYGMYLYLHDKERFGDKAVAVNVGAAARDSKKFVNAKAEYYWGLRMKFQAGELTGIEDERTIGQLTAIRYSQPHGKIAIEGKDVMVKRGVKSPDRAEAIMLAHATPSNYGQMFGAVSVQVGDTADAVTDVLYQRSPWR